MAFSLKKWVTGMLESTRLNDTNTNWTDIESAIDTLQTNASLLMQSNLSSTAASVEEYFDDLLQNNPSSIPNIAISFRDVSIAGHRWIMTINRRDNQLVIHAFTANNARYYYRSTSGTWSVKQVTLTTL
jgi:predicted alpha/beta-fold hydrolase